MVYIRAMTSQTLYDIGSCDLYYVDYVDHAINPINPKGLYVPNLLIWVIYFQIILGFFYIYIYDWYRRVSYIT